MNKQRDIPAGCDPASVRKAEVPQARGVQTGSQTCVALGAGGVGPLWSFL